MLVVNRFRAAEDDVTGSAMRDDLVVVRDLLEAATGCLGTTIGRNLDDPSLWVLSSRWEHVGAYRRALSSYDFKMHGLPRYVRALDEPSAYEVVEPDAVLNQAATRVT